MEIHQIYGGFNVSLQDFQIQWDIQYHQDNENFDEKLGWILWEAIFLAIQPITFEIF